MEKKIETHDVYKFIQNPDVNTGVLFSLKM